MSNNTEQQQQLLLVVAILTIAPDAVNQFREYETRAARILARYGGVMERTVEVEPSASREYMREVHVLSFPSKEAFASYRIDTELATLAELRAVCIAHTDILIGREGPRYIVPAR